jgi:DNA-binding NarL/FixJ family response regulator
MNDACRDHAVKRVRVVVLNMRRMMHDIILGILASQPDIEVGNESEAPLQPPAMLLRPETDVVILEQRTLADADAYVARATAPRRLKVLVITDDGRQTLLYELRPRRMVLGELSPPELLGAIRGAVAEGSWSEVE